jgi:hypothetical protein
VEIISLLLQAAAVEVEVEKAGQPVQVDTVVAVE